MLRFRPVAKQRGGSKHPLPPQQFILNYLRQHREGFSGEMHRAYKAELDRIAVEKGKKKPYKHPTYPSFYRTVWGMAKEGHLVKSGRQEEADAPQFDEWDQRPMRVYYRLAR